MYVYLYSTYILYRSVCLPVVYSYTILNEVVKTMTTRKYTVLNGNFVFDLCVLNLRDIFHERNPGVKRHLLVYLLCSNTLLAVSCMFWLKRGHHHVLCQNIQRK